MIPRELFFQNGHRGCRWASAKRVIGQASAVCADRLTTGTTNWVVGPDGTESRLPVDGDVLAFGEGEQSFGATLAAQTAFFHTAERCRRIGHQPSIEPHHPGLDSLAHSKATGEIRRIDIRNEAVLG